MSGSRTTLAGRLARMGFADAGDRPKPDAVLAALAAAADGMSYNQILKYERSRL